MAARVPKRDLGACGSDKKVTEKNEVLLHEGDGLMSVDRLTKCKNAVCMIRCETRCPNTGERLRKRGSGFYAKAKIFGIEHRCLVTNNHVISCKQDAAIAIVIFHFESENHGISVQLRPNTMFYTNMDLDYSVIGVDEDQLNRIYPRIFPIEYYEQPQATVGDDIFIFQHPLGEPKKFSYEKIIHIEDPFVYYIADTDEGSSGSPVLRKFQLMAIHLRGSKEDGYNKGTLFSAVINDLHVGCNITNFGAVTLKRNFNRVERKSPTEMDEASCKRVCVDTSNNNSETSAELREGANMMCETQPELPDDKMLDKLSQECCGFYKKLGRQLGVKPEKIEEISKDHINYGSLSEKSYQVLHECKQSNSTEFTNQTLENVLRSMGKNALADKYFGRK